MTNGITEEKLADIRNTFSQKVEEVKKMPGELDHVVDKLKYTAPLIYLKITDTRDAIQKQLKKLLEKIEEAVKGMFAPWLFIDYASKWQEVGTKILSAKGKQTTRELILEGQWDGSAYKSFKTTKESQEKAMGAVKDLCDKIHDQLLVVAEEGRNLYMNLINNFSTVIAELAVFVSETSATAGAAAVWTINDLNNAITAGVNVIVNLITDFVETSTKAYIASNELKNMIRSPDGLDNGRWPASVGNQFDDKDDDWHLDGDEK